MRTVTRVLAFVFLLAGGLPSAAVAQIGAGVKGGVVISTLSTSPDVSDVLDTLADFTGGAFVILDPDARVTGQFEVLLSRRGADVTANVFGFGGVGKIRATYVDISALGRARLGGTGGTQVYVFAGPMIGLETQADLVVSGVGFSQDIDPLTEDVDVALTVGAGADVNRIVFEARYTHGFRNLITAVDILGVEAKSRSASLMVGFRF